MERMLWKSMNSKNLLQEYCQKNRLLFPIYESERIQDGLFISKVKVCGKEYIGKPKDKKKEAERSVATEAYNDICAENLKKKYSYAKKERLGIFIDLENKQKIYDELDKYFYLDRGEIHIHIFVTRNHDLAQKEYQHATKHIIDSMLKDAADVYMIFMLGKLVNKYEDLIIVSGDHYAKVLEEILVREGKKVNMCTNIEEIMKIVKKE